MLNDIDISSLESEDKKVVNLDDMLNDAASSVLATTPSSAQASEVQKVRIVSDQIKPWLAFTANVPAETREKWTKMVKVDCDTEVTSKFSASSAYRAWDPSTASKMGLTKSLHDLVKKSAGKCGIDEVKTMKILSLVNPVTDTEHGKQLQSAFTKQLVNDLKSDIQSDPNFSAERFPLLAKTMAN